MCNSRVSLSRSGTIGWVIILVTWLRGIIGSEGTLSTSIMSLFLAWISCLLSWTSRCSHAYTFSPLIWAYRLRKRYIHESTGLPRSTCAATFSSFLLGFSSHWKTPKLSLSLSICFTRNPLMIVVAYFAHCKVWKLVIRFECYWKLLEKLRQSYHCFRFGFMTWVRSGIFSRLLRAIFHQKILIR